MTQDDLELAARQFEEAAAELERAIAHCHVAAQRFRLANRRAGARTRGLRKVTCP